MSEVLLDEVQWRSPEWIQANGLRTDNILEYFSLSPFYDRSSNNQVLKMQTVYNEQLQRPDLHKELQNMTGTEFVLAAAQEPNLWIIRRQNRRSPTEADIEATYYVVGENIYQAPSVYNVVLSRLLATSQSLYEALNIAEQLPNFTPMGYTYTQSKISIQPVEAAKTPEPPTPQPASGGDEGDFDESHMRDLGRALAVTIAHAG